MKRTGSRQHARESIARMIAKIQKLEAARHTEGYVWSPAQDTAGCRFEPASTVGQMTLPSMAYVPFFYGRTVGVLERPAGDEARISTLDQSLAPVALSPLNDLPTRPESGTGTACKRSAQGVRIEARRAKTNAKRAAWFTRADPTGTLWKALYAYSSSSNRHTGLPHRVKMNV